MLAIFREIKTFQHDFGSLSRELFTSVKYPILRSDKEKSRDKSSKSFKLKCKKQNLLFRNLY